ncbi:MAG: 50S ribosomal protein L25/general stress protein Ctc [Bacteroidales bacterium]|jgi:large subunit ribosomal protein L25|nr:50S ribosomal protein L25/general stress protein Ctc [Bacteroidales bacterium]HHT52614.1 50S ribosomal protein L25/general stress protein Ctc [Bacteroidales bacterium]
MKSVSISGSLRENVGKKDAKAQRRKGFIPCVMYGGAQQYTFVVEEKQFQPLFYTPEVKYAVIDLDGKKYNAIVQDSQWHPVSDKLLHVDFLEVSDSSEVNIGIPVRTVGTSPGVLKGGRLSLKVRKINVKGLLNHIPEVIEVDVSKLNIGDSIKVSDITLENLAITDRKSQIIASVATTRTAVTDEEEEGAEGEGTEGAAEGAETAAE